MFTKRLSRDLFRAIACNDEDEVARLISRGANVNKVMKHRHVKDLIKHNLADKNTAIVGTTPLVMAAEREYIGIMKILIEAGAHLNCIGTRGSPLEIAVEGSHTQAIKLLCKAGAIPPFTGRDYQSTPAYKAYEVCLAENRNTNLSNSENTDLQEKKLSQANIIKKDGLFSAKQAKATPKLEVKNNAITLNEYVGPTEQEIMNPIILQEYASALKLAGM